jgi:hypothetical protein
MNGCGDRHDRQRRDNPGREAVDEERLELELELPRVRRVEDHRKKPRVSAFSAIAGVRLR